MLQSKATVGFHLNLLGPGQGVIVAVLLIEPPQRKSSRPSTPTPMLAGLEVGAEMPCGAGTCEEQEHPPPSTCSHMKSFLPAWASLCSRSYI